MGFWSILGSIAGSAISLIPGVGPIAGALIKGAGAVGGGVADALTTKSGGSGATQGGMLSVDAGKSDPGLADASQTLGQAKGYYQKALGGSQEEMEGLLGPEVSTVLGQYDNAAKTAAELGPRGGGRTAILAEAPFKKAGVYGQQLAGAKKGAVEGLTTIGQAQGQIGQAQNQFKLGQAGVNAGQNSSILRANEAKAKSYNDIGAGIGGILTRIILGNKGGFGDRDSTSGITGNSSAEQDWQRSLGA